MRTVEEHVATLRAEAELVAVAATMAGDAAPVPSCPGWTVRDVLAHLGGVHRWAGDVIAGRVTEVGDPRSLAGDLCGPALVEWLRAGADSLATSLEAAPDDLAAMTFLPNALSPKHFWARRQAHETSVHRIDLQLAAGSSSAVPAEAATDGIDELLTGFLSRGHKLRGGRSGTLVFATTDTGLRWRLELTSAGPRGRVCAGASGADTVISGTSAALYLRLWHREPPGLPDLEVSGDTALFDGWLDAVRIGWA